MVSPRPVPLKENPAASGWYAVVRNIPEGSFLDSDHWDGATWRGEDVLSHYPLRFETEDEADAWVRSHDDLEQAFRAAPD
jgi:hypothetical protein